MDRLQRDDLKQVLIQQQQQIDLLTRLASRLKCAGPPCDGPTRLRGADEQPVAADRLCRGFTREASLTT